MKYYKIWLPILSIILFFGLAELVCRGFDLTSRLDADFKFYIQNVDNDIRADYMAEDAFLMWFPKQNYNRGDINTNSQGFRDKEYQVNKDKNVFRILCLGDSSTFGYGVPIQDAYHTLLENKLNLASAHNGIRYEVINAGVTGYTSYQGLRLYELIGVKYSPDIVTFYLGANDQKKTFCLNDKQIMQHDVPTMIKAKMESSFLLKSHSYRILRTLIVNSFKIENSIGKDVPRVKVSDFKLNILELNRLCKEHGSLLIMISFPCNKTNDVTLLYKREMESISKQYNIPLVSIPEMSDESPLDNNIFFLDSIHPNQLGHQRIMERLYDCLVTNKLLPSAKG